MKQKWECELKTCDVIIARCESLTGQKAIKADE